MRVFIQQTYYINLPCVENRFNMVSVARQSSSNLKLVVFITIFMVH